MSPSLVVVIDREVPSVNKTMYRHWRAYTKERDVWMLLLRVKLRPRRPPATPVRMILRSLRARIIDYANFVAGAKPIPDCLIRLGYLRDDAPAWFHCDYEQLQAPRALRCTRLEFLTPTAI